MVSWRRERTVVSFLVSGSGLNFSVVAKNILGGDIRARVGAVITDNAKARVLERAKEMGVPAFFVDPEEYCSREIQEEKIIMILNSYKTGLVVAAGYMRLLTPNFVSRYRNRIINIHPSLLPSFPGIRSQYKALEYGVKITGCTTHFIDEGVDTGPIIMQSPVAVLEHDTVDSLSERILNEEYRILSQSIRLFCHGKLKVARNKVIIQS
jgi:phosphoribosylglycinamide formyltransferase 1